MSVFISKDENLKLSSVNIGYIILSLLEKNDSSKTSMYSIYKELSKKGIKSYRQMLFGILFLYSLDLIDFEKPYIVAK